MNTTNENRDIIIHYNAQCGCKYDELIDTRTEDKEYLDRVYCTTHKALLDEKDRLLAHWKNIISDLERKCITYQVLRKQIVDSIGYVARYEEETEETTDST